MLPIQLTTTPAIVLADEPMLSCLKEKEKKKQRDRDYCFDHLDGGRDCHFAHRPMPPRFHWQERAYENHVHTK